MSYNGLKINEVRIEEYNISWSKKFLSEKALLLNVLDNKIKSIEHIGSTSIPEMPAKPIIDILIGINKYKDFKKLIRPLENAGYVFHREPRRYEAFFLKKTKDDRTTHHLKVVKFNGTNWRKYILFKERLINNKKYFNQYKKLKLDLSIKFKEDRKQYTLSKNELLKKLLEK